MRISLQDYKKIFINEKINENALKSALDIRKFEIELYWKRAAYFWTFIGATFAAFFALLNSDKVSYSVLFLVDCLGFIFSLCWLMVNKGSKFWQNNWESHVDLLEDEINGELYKTGIYNANISLWNPFSEYPFSVSKINQLLSCVLVIVWFMLGVSTIGWAVVKFFHLNSTISTEKLLYLYKYSEGISILILSVSTTLFASFAIKCGRTKGIPDESEDEASSEDKQAKSDMVIFQRKKKGSSESDGDVEDSNIWVR